MADIRVSLTEQEVFEALAEYVENHYGFKPKLGFNASKGPERQPCVVVTVAPGDRPGQPTTASATVVCAAEKKK